MKILVWSGIFNTLINGITPVFLATNRPKINFWITFLQVVSFFLFITPAAKIFGIEGVGAIVSISSFIAFTVSLILVKLNLSLSFSDIYHSFRPSLISGLVMCLFFIILKTFFGKIHSSIIFNLNFIFGLLLLILCYGLSLFLIDRSALKEFKQMLFPQIEHEK